MSLSTQTLLSPQLCLTGSTAAPQDRSVPYIVKQMSLIFFFLFVLCYAVQMLMQYYLTSVGMFCVLLKHGSYYIQYSMQIKVSFVAL